MTILQRFVLTLFLALPTIALATPKEIPISLDQYTATNIPGAAQYINGSSLAFDTNDAAPPGDAYYFLRYHFTIPAEQETGAYSLVLRAGKGPGSRGQSDFSWAIDGGKLHPALRRQLVTPEPGVGEHVQLPVILAAGDHTLEFRFYPDQRLRVMNRVTEPFVGHRVNLQGILWRPASASRPSNRKPLCATCHLHHGDRIVVFGDSITEEEYYAHHIIRILDQAFPGNGIEVYDAGISLNRSIDGVARVDKDVAALSPDWTVMAFGVNDATQLSPEDYAQNCAVMVRDLQGNGSHVLCASPSGMLPNAESMGSAFFSLHASDRAAAIDRTMAMNAYLLHNVAISRKALFADIYTAIAHSNIPRFTLMDNQWHPNDEGGRMMALAMLRAWGLTQTDIARTGDSRDTAYYRALEATVPAAAPSTPAVKPLAAPLNGAVIVGTAYGDNRLLVYTRDGHEMASVATPHHPAALAYSKSRKELYVACEGAGILRIYHLPDLHRIADIELGLEAYPTSLALSRDETTLWVGSYFGSKIIEMNLATRTARREIPMPGIVNGIALAPDGSTLVASLPGKLAIVDPIAGKVTGTIDTLKFTTPCIIMPDGRMVVIDAEHWQSYPVDIAGLKLGAPTPTPAQTRALAVDPTTGRLYAADWMNDRLLEFDGSHCIHATPLPAPVLALAVLSLD